MNSFKRKNGISLVALVITIIVLIILTAAVVITGINAPENAEYAVKMHNKATVQDAVTLYVMTEMLNSTNATNVRDVADIVKDLYEDGTWKTGAEVKLGISMTLAELNTVFEVNDKAVVTFAAGQEPPFNQQGGNNNNQTYSWANKTAVFVGDSITAGVGATKTYLQMLDEQIPLSTVTNMGISSSCISSTSNRGTNYQPLINRYQTIPNADLIAVLMGTNDYGANTPLGTMADTTDISFYGALNVIVPSLKQTHTNSTLVFITPINRTNGSNKNSANATLEDYVNAIKDVCESNNVSVIDLYTLFDLDVNDGTVKSQYIPDGLHPNAEGHQIMADLIAEELKKIAPPVNNTQQGGSNDDQQGGSNDDQQGGNNDDQQGGTYDDITMQIGNKYYAQLVNSTKMISLTKNIYLEAGTVISLKNTSYQYGLYEATSEEVVVVGAAITDGWVNTNYTVTKAGWYGITINLNKTVDLGGTDPNVLSGYVNITK